MAGMKVGMAFERTSVAAIDESLTLTKAQMVAVDDNKMPDKYFTICTDDGKLYLYDKSATPNAETGKYTLQQSGETYDDSELRGRVETLETGQADRYTKSETDAKIDEKLANYDKLDYKKADSPPTATEVVIKGQTVPVVEGVRYIVPDTAENRMDEYVVLEGEVWYLGSAAGGNVGEFETGFTVSNPIGKYQMDEEVKQGDTFEGAFKKMLSETYNPVLTPPSASLTFSSPTLAKVGATVNGGTATLGFNRGKIDPQYTAESQYRAGVPTNYNLKVAGADITFDENNTDGVFTVPSFTKTGKGMVTLTGTVTHEEGCQPKDSDGGNFESPLAAGDVATSKNVEFILPFVYGAIANDTITDFTGLTEELVKKSNTKEYFYDTDYEHPMLAFDAAYGNLKSILDQNGFETIGGWDVSSVTVDGQLYTVYVHANKTTDTNAKFTFKF